MKISSYMKTIMRIISPVLTSHLNSKDTPKEDTEYTSLIVYQLKIRKIDGEDKTWLISMFILVNLCLLIDLFCWLFNLHKKIGKYLRRKNDYCLTEVVVINDCMRIRDLSIKNYKKNVMADSITEASKPYHNILSREETLVKSKDNLFMKKDLFYDLDDKVNKPCQENTQIVLYHTNRIGHQNEPMKKEILSTYSEEKFDFKTNRKKIEQFFLNMHRKKEISLDRNELKSIYRKFDFDELIKLWKEKENN